MDTSGAPARGSQRLSDQFRVLLVDDNLEFIESARRFLMLDPHVEVVGIAHSGTTALKLVAVLHPQVVLLDMSMPDMNGLEVVRHIKAQPNPPCVIIVTLHSSSAFREAALAAKADGFIAKTDFGEQSLAQIYKMCGYSA